MNIIAKDTKIESTLAKYLEFRIFELFKNRLYDIILPYAREESKEDLYKHIFLCPPQLSKTRNFQLHGVLSPFVCMWRTSPLEFPKDFYARSVLGRTFEYTKKDGSPGAEEGFLYDLKFDIELFSSSYYRTFRDRVNQDILDMDRLRYFYIDIKELLHDCEGMNTRIELMLTGIQATDNLDAKGNRSFDLNMKYTVRVTIPYCRGSEYPNAIEVYLNENRIFFKEVEEVDQSSEG